MKKKWLLLTVFAVIVSFTLLPINFLNADPAGTSLIVTKSAVGSSEGDLTWGIEKSADQETINIAMGQTSTVYYTVTVTPLYNETGRTVSGKINIQNTGSADASITYVKDVIEYKIGDGPWTALPAADVSGPFTISSGSFSEIPYSIAFTHIAGATEYRNTALVLLENYSIPGGGVGSHEFDYTVSFSISGGTAHNPFANVSDSLCGPLGTTWVGDPITYTYTYPWTIGPYALPGDYTVDNTATVTGIELPTSATDSISIIIHVAPLKAYALINSGVPGKGLETAPGQQKPFNPKSKASEHAGMKK